MLHLHDRLTGEKTLSDITQPPNEWRRGLNQAVRAFASEAAGAEAESFQSLVRTLLRDVAETLDIECCTLISLAESQTGTVESFEWCRTMMLAAGLPFNPRAFALLLERVKHEHHPVIVESAHDVDPDDAAMSEASAYLRKTLIRSVAIIPVGLEDTPTWAWILGSAQEGGFWTESVIEHLQVVGDIVSSPLNRRMGLLEAAEIKRSRDHAIVKERPAPLVKHVPLVHHEFEEIIGQSPSLLAALARLREVVNSETSVVLLGETGTGKELFARALHAHGPRRAFPLVSVNCAALPPTLIESELFGHQRGAFTGAIAPRQGRFELAHHGTLFLDEIGDLPLELQPKLLRVLQEGAFERVGSSQTHAVDVRIIAATHRDLGRAVAEGEFRADLYYRLTVFPIRLPPLRERREDIAALVWSIIQKRQRTLQRHITAVPDDVLEALQQYSWPGNIRELENVIERALIHTSGSKLTLLEGSLEAPEPPAAVGTTLMSVERAHIEEVLQDCRWRINGTGNAAERLGLHPNTLRFRMKKLGIVRRDPLKDARAVRPAAGSQARDRAS
jgi:formate hydrogenlyase transcriptional activator